VEFTQAPFGILGLETAWGLIGRELIEPGVLSVETAVQKLTVAPRRILGLDVPEIAEGEPARLTIFDASTRWTFTEAHVRSKSENTPFVGREMVGRPRAVYSEGQFVECTET
jgi:dihydroorotase